MGDVIRNDRDWHRGNSRLEDEANLIAFRGSKLLTVGQGYVAKVLDPICDSDVHVVGGDVECFQLRYEDSEANSMHFNGQVIKCKDGFMQIHKDIVEGIRHCSSLRRA